MSVGVAVLKVFLLLVGFVLLVKGADFFVDGASGIASIRQKGKERKH